MLLYEDSYYEGCEFVVFHTSGPCRTDIESAFRGPTSTNDWPSSSPFSRPFIQRETENYCVPIESQNLPHDTWNTTRYTNFLRTRCQSAIMPEAWYFPPGTRRTLVVTATSTASPSVKMITPRNSVWQISALTSRNGFATGLLYATREASQS